MGKVNQSKYIAATRKINLASLLILSIVGVIGVGCTPNIGKNFWMSNPANLENSSELSPISTDELLKSTTPINIAPVSTMEGSPDTAITPGYLSVSRSQIVDPAGQPFKFSGVAWSGLELIGFVPGGLDRRSWMSILNQIKSTGFNSIRLPFSSEALDQGPQDNNPLLNLNFNPELAEKTPLEIMDKIIEYCGEIGLKVLLERNRNDADPEANADGLWYTTNYDQSRFLNDWKMLAERYAGNPTVIGADLFGKPHGATWGTNDPLTDWTLIVERTANLIHSVEPGWLIFAKGIFQYQGVANAWRGGNFRGQSDRPLVINAMNKLVFSPRAYGPQQSEQPWFQEANFPNNLPSYWRNTWSFILFDQNLPVVLAEFDPDPSIPRDFQWATQMFSVLDGDADGDGIKDLPSEHEGVGWFIWAVNPLSSPASGILKPDWETVRPDKLAMLSPQMFKKEESFLTFQVTLEGSVSKSINVRISTEDFEALADEDYVPINRVITLWPGFPETINVPLYPDITPEKAEKINIRVQVLDPTPEIGIGVAKTLEILDDD